MLYNGHVVAGSKVALCYWSRHPNPRATTGFLLNWVHKLDDMMTGFIKYMRSEAAQSLLTKPLANHLLSVIASRARYHSDPINGLDVGQCFMGDFTTIGLTRQQYRSNLQLLEKAQIITTRTTNKGTIVTLINSDIYDINSTEQPSSQPTSNQQATIQQPSSNHPATTNKEGKKERKEEGKGSRFAPPSVSEVYDFMKTQDIDNKSSHQESDKLVDFYTSKNWQVGKTKMKDWKASARNWIRKAIADGTIQKAEPAAIPTWKERGFPNQEAFLAAQEKQGKAAADRRLNG